MNDPISDNTLGIIAVLSIFVLSPIAIAFARTIWKRAGEPRPPKAVDSIAAAQTPAGPG